MLKVPTIKILIGTDFSSNLTRFLVNVKGAQLNIGGAEALRKRYKVTPYAAKMKSVRVISLCACVCVPFALLAAFPAHA